LITETAIDASPHLIVIFTHEIAPGANTACRLRMFTICSCLPSFGLDISKAQLLAKAGGAISRN
jgi:hypothetical protein